MKTSVKKIRVLHVPTVTGGNPPGIARAEREIGLESSSISLFQNIFEYKVDKVLWQSCHFSIANELKRLKLIKQAIFNYGVIHYNFGTTIAYPIYRFSLNDNYSVWLRWPYWLYTNLLQRIELTLMAVSKKMIFVTYQGDDARQGDYCKNNYDITAANEVEPGYYSECSDKAKRVRIKLLSKYCDGIYALNPDLLNVLPSSAEFLPYSHIDLNEWQATNSNNERLLLIHAPSHQKVKGTRYIIEAVNRLKKEGVDFDFELIEGLANKEARKKYEKADLLIDQLLIGWYGGLSVELMALGKPVICYIREEDLKFIPKKMRKDLPVINSTPDSVYTVLKIWLNKSREELREQGMKGRAYVEEWHDPLKVAMKLKNDYTKALSERRK